MRSIVFLVTFLFIGLLHAEGQKLEFRTLDKNLGWHFIIFTTDTAKCSPRKKPPFTFDQNNVVYLHTSFKSPMGIKIINEKSEDISPQMREIMKSEDCLRFYRPTAEEIKNHPTFDEYYMSLSEKAMMIYLDLKKKGYTIKDLKIAEE